jgi:CheY-like chemotaxis protein
MPVAKVKLLIVDDDVLILMLLSQIFTDSGYSVRSAEDGFSALAVIRNEIPDIILSDLNMPGMSGFEFLSVVRRRFPATRASAMSGALSGDGVPPGVVADAFYEKGTNVSSLLQIMHDMADMECSFFRHPGALAPIWIPKNGHDPSGEEYVTVTCPECLRAFPQVLGKDILLINETDCVHCSSLVHYAIVQPMNPIFPQASRQKSGLGMPTSLHAPNFSE